MTSREPCPATSHLPYRSIDGGWPYGRVECVDCHGFVFQKRNGQMVKHVPHRGDNPFEAERRAQLEEANR